MTVEKKALSNLGRPLDPEYPSNLFVMVVSMASFFGFGIYSYLSGGGIIGSLGFGAGSLLTVFLTWALARELDPDHQLTAVLSMAGAIVSIGVNGVPGLLLPFWALFSVRILNRSTGLKAGPLDNLISVGLAIWLGYSSSWVIPAAGTGFFIADSLVREPKRLQIVPGTITGVGAGYFLFMNPDPWGGFLGYPVKLGMVFLLTALFLLVVYDSKNVDSTGDRTDKPLSPYRVQLAQLIFLATALFLPLWAGEAGFHESVTFWSVIGAASLVHLVRFMGLSTDYIEKKLT
ncbi:MAG: hypothetical protein ACOC9A_01845 [Candidatus Bipolaricaulota bacterium]